ncbi:MAG TPA: tRNA (adenosine(37)-N6)-threonylcarbamoyltransferase complex ATPase subunit type 1 TsaE [Dehalococcoidia bacterium]|nr:tRNA (adenosine(37)-N6)-threonylcarbamoyltransferase complex ATPase subunit type 1 TsaE [Dehalococcoidia bacterium]
MTTNRAGALVSGGPEETRRLGERLGAVLRPEDVILLSGELGAGKTVFVEGLARGLGVAHAVSSKSFVLLGEYTGRIKLYHADLYRLESVEQVEELGLDDYCSDGALVVEWPERAWDLFSGDALVVRFSIVDESSRELTLEARGPRGRELAVALAA